MTYDPTKTPQELRAHIGSLNYASIHRDQLLPLLDDLAAKDAEIEKLTKERDSFLPWVVHAKTIADALNVDPTGEARHVVSGIATAAENRVRRAKDIEIFTLTSDLRLAREALGPFIDPAVHLTFMGDRDRRIYLSVTRPEYQAAKIAAHDLASRPATEGGAK